MRRVFLSVAMVAAGMSSPSNADDTVKRTAELQVLDRFVGTWDLVVTTKLPNGETTTVKTAETRTWSTGGKFVRFENPKEENPESPEFHMLLTYDPAAKQYPGVFMSGPSRAQLNGTWDTQTQTMTLSGKFDDGGINVVSTNRFIDDQHVEVAAKLTDADGKVLVEIFHTHTRRNK